MRDLCHGKGYEDPWQLHALIAEPNLRRDMDSPDTTRENTWMALADC